MNWIAYCTICGELERAPNGPMMEAVARLHRRDTGHMTIIGYEPELTEEEKRSKRVVGGAHEVLDRISQPLDVESLQDKPYPETYSDWKHEKVGRTEMRGRITPTGIEFEQVSSGYDQMDVDIATKRITEALKQRPFPQTYSDWVSLGVDIKEKVGIDDFETTTRVNLTLGHIDKDDEFAEEAKRWLTNKAAELGLT